MDITTVAPELSYEIERGKPMPSLNHGVIQYNIGLELAPYRKQYRFATEVSLRLDGWPSTPDIIILPKEKVDFHHDQVELHKPPLGVIEIISPSQSVQMLFDKAVQYFETGVRSVWLAVPTLQLIVVYRSPDASEQFSSGILTDPVLGISISVDRVFEREE